MKRTSFGSVILGTMLLTNNIFADTILTIENNTVATSLTINANISPLLLYIKPNKIGTISSKQLDAVCPKNSFRCSIHIMDGGWNIGDFDIEWNLRPISFYIVSQSDMQNIPYILSAPINGSDARIKDRITPPNLS